MYVIYLIIKQNVYPYKCVPHTTVLMCFFYIFQSISTKLHAIASNTQNRVTILIQNGSIKDQLLTKAKKKS